MDDAEVLGTLIAQARERLARGAVQPAKLLLERALMALVAAVPAAHGEARKTVAAMFLDLGEHERAVYALGEGNTAPALLRRAAYEAAARLREGAVPCDGASNLVRRSLGLAAFSPADIRHAGREMSGLLDPFDHVGALRPPIVTEQVYTICMMPRSGSNFLVDCLTETGILGRPGEYLHRNEPTALPSIAARFRTESLEAAMAEIMARTRTPNGVFGTKAHIGMLLPLLVEGTFARTLAPGKFIYTTRDDLLMQAISFVRAQMTGVWIAKNEADADATFDFDRIRTAIDDLSAMMTQWEMLFALHGIQPLRITYEAINSDMDKVIAAIADFLGVPLNGPTHFRERRTTVQRDSISEEWRRRFLAEGAASELETAQRPPHPTPLPDGERGPSGARR